MYANLILKIRQGMKSFMSEHNSVVWSQGLFLRPEHFQQERRYNDFQSSSITRSILPYRWGVSTLEIQTSELTNSQIAIGSASGILPDGLAFDTRVENNVPASLNLKSFSRNVIIFLAVSRARADTMQISTDEGHSHHRRFIVKPTKVIDTSHTGKNTESVATDDFIEVAVPNLKLVSSEDNLDDLDCIPIARIKDVDSNGVAELDHSFVPTCLSVLCSDYLIDATRNLRSTLTTLHTKFFDHLKTVNFDTSLDAFADQTILQHHAFPLALTLNRFSANYQHLISRDCCHPEELYAKLLEFYAELSSFLTPHKIDPYEITPYNHLDIGSSMRELTTSIDNMMNMMIDNLSTILGTRLTQSAVQTETIKDDDISEIDPEPKNEVDESASNGIVVPVGKN